MIRREPKGVGDYSASHLEMTLEHRHPSKQLSMIVVGFVSRPSDENVTFFVNSRPFI